MIAFAITLWSLLWITAEPNENSALKSGYPRIELIESLRFSFMSNLGSNPNDAQALVAGLAIGERSLLSDHTASAMRDLSLTHLVAVSGANLAIVVGAVWFALAALGLGRNLRFGIGLAAMAGYVLLVGPESSVIRAATMALFVTTALWLGRGSSALHALALAVVVILVVDPAMATDFGFALSALATVGLLVAAPPLYQLLKTRLPEFLALGVAASFAAQLYTTPVLLMLQPGLPIYAVLANLMVEPVIAPVTIVGISAAVLAIVSPLMSELLIQVAEFGTSWIVTVATSLSSLPMVRVHFVGPPAGVALMAAAVIGITGYFQSDSPKLKQISLLVVLISSAMALALTLLDITRHSRALSDWVVLNCDVGQGDGLLIRSQGKTSLIDVGPDPVLIRECLESAGVERIDLLIISHYDSDHVAGIDGLQGIDLGLTLLPGFADDRPLAEKVEQVVKGRSMEVATAQRGMFGELGGCSWEILQPSHSAAEASDSNDASVIALFECKEYRLLALGDLGEAGQNRLLATSKSAFQGDSPLILKVAHHGSADQSRELHAVLRPALAIISVGKNRFGHPTERVIRILNSAGARILRTDRDGPVALGLSDDQLTVRAAGKLTR